jgi:hypothetical protein
MTKRIHVTQRADGDWQARREIVSRAGSIHTTQEDAIAAARKTAQREGGEVVIHGRDGKIRDADSFGNDPHPPRDRRH